MPSRISILATALLLVACSGRERVVAAETATRMPYGAYDQVGLASWYGEELAGARTASGDRFDPAGITAAHRSLPLGSFAEVTAVDSGRSIIVRVNDRGPGRRDRIIDLSRGAARLLGTDRQSLANVRVRAITPSGADLTSLRAGRAMSLSPASPIYVRAASIGYPAAFSPIRKLERNGRYLLQIASFSNESRARALADRLDADVLSVGGLWRVRLGPYKGGDAVQRARDAVAEHGYGDAQILLAD